MFTCLSLNDTPPRAAWSIVQSTHLFSFVWIAGAATTQCLWHTNYYQRYLLGLLQIAVVLLLAITVIHRCNCGLASRVAFELANLSLLPVASRSVQMLVCDDTFKCVDKSILPISDEFQHAYVRVDYTIVCDTDKHSWMIALTMVVMSAWCGLVPALAFAKIYSKRKLLNPQLPVTATLRIHDDVEEVFALIRDLNLEPLLEVTNEANVAARYLNVSRTKVGNLIFMHKDFKPECWWCFFCLFDCPFEPIAFPGIAGQFAKPLCFF